MPLYELSCPTCDVICTKLMSYDDYKNKDVLCSECSTTLNKAFPTCNFSGLPTPRFKRKDS